MKGSSIAVTGLVTKKFDLGDLDAASSLDREKAKTPAVAHHMEFNEEEKRYARVYFIGKCTGDMI